MKQYYITIQYTHSNLSTMEKDLLDQVRPFSRCLIHEGQIEELMEYMRAIQAAFHEAKPRLKTSKISRFDNGMGIIFIHVGQITMLLQEVSGLPPTFYNFLSNGQL